MKNLITLLVIFAIVLVANAQVGPYSHVVSGSYRSGYRIANGFAKWDTKNNKLVDLPTASFTGPVGFVGVSDIAPAGNGFLVVGDFTAINGVQANGIAYFDGNRWCSYPHLNLYYYVKPFPQDTKFPRAASLGAVAGSAAAIYASGNDYYVFGGVGGTGTTRFNQVGSFYSNVAGLVRLKFDGTSNFTVDSSLNYESQGVGPTGTEPSTNGFPADAAYGAPTTTLGKTKLRVISVSGTLSFYVHPNVGTASHIYRWRQNDGNWLQLTANTPTFTAFNVSGVSTQFTVAAQALGAVVLDFDADVSANVLFIAGQFDNSLNTTGNVQYVNVASCNNGHSQTITWAKTVNWANYNNYNNTMNIPTTGTYPQRATAITVINQNNFYVAQSFQSQDTNDALYRNNQYVIYSVQSQTPNIVGGRFGKFYTTANIPQTTINRLANYNGKVYAYGDFELINYVIDQANLWPRRYTRRISNAVYYDGADWQNAYGGYTTVTATNIPSYAAVSGYDYLFVSGATSFYDIHSAGRIVAYNTKTYGWANMATQRLTTRNGVIGDDGIINAVHFIKKGGDANKNKVVVAGNFDWYGTQYLGSVAYLNTNTLVFEQLGGGVFIEESGTSFSADQVFPVYRAGTVNDIEETNDKFYVGGVFTKNINGKCLGNLASVSTTGGTFEAVGNGCDAGVWDLLANGDWLYVGGSFSNCNGIQGTRRIAAYNTKKSTWSALSAGLPGGRVFAMIWWNGKLLAGGNFGNAPGAYRTAGSPNTGLYTWDGKRWAPLTGKCQINCDGSDLTYPFNAGDPLARTINNVKSLRTIGGNLYILGDIFNGQSGSLIQYDGSRFRQYGAATNAGCTKQGCLASNQSNIIGGGFQRPEGGYNINYEQYNPDYKNWIETYTGFETAPIIVASANLISFTILSLVIVALFAL